MSQVNLLQMLFYFIIILLLVRPLGWYIYRVYEGKSCGLNNILGPIERWFYRICGIDTKQEMSWKTYLYCMLIFNMFGMLLLYLILRIQYYLPLNPESYSSIPPDLSFNTAASFVTNTDWQAYSGETSISYLTQMLGMTVQNFLSAATGISLFVALTRGFSRQASMTLGNYWVDMIRGTLYILLPLACILAIALNAQGVIQNLNPYQKIYSIQNPAEEQTLPMGPVASQVAIEQLGSNGGGFFNVNASHPFQNPTPFTNLLEMLAILLIPAALCYTFGMLINDKKQGWAILCIMLVLLIPVAIVTIISEQQIIPTFMSLDIQQTGNMEGKELRFGIFNSAFWTSLTTATSNGSVNSMLDSYTPLGEFAALWLMHLGEIAFGGVGSGMYGIIMVFIIAVFIAGLMVGRTPEFLGKKIEPFEMKMACVAVLVMPLFTLLLTAIASVTTQGTSSITNPGPHGFSQILYAFTSMGNNNGSAFSGLQANTLFYNIAGGIEMLLSRYWIAIPVLAIAGSMAKKTPVPKSAGTLCTHTPLFIFFIVSVSVIIGGLSFLPSLALGPIVEHLTFWGYHGS